VLVKRWDVLRTRRLPDGRRVIKDTYDFYNTSRSINVQEFEEMGPAEKALAVFKDNG
jgi:hypothetical protein